MSPRRAHPQSERIVAHRFSLDQADEAYRGRPGRRWKTCMVFE